MKYIKTFEKIKNSDLKKYFVTEKDVENNIERSNNADT